MAKKLVLIALMVPLVFFWGCNLDGSGDEERIYETPDGALIYSFYAAYNVITEGFEAVVDGANEGTGIINFSSPELIVNGTVSVTSDGPNTKKTYIASLDYSGFSFDLYFLGDITGSLEVNLILTTDISSGETVSGSYTVTGSVAVSGLDNISAMELNMAADFMTDEETGDIIIDGVYYHAAELLLTTNTIVGIWEYLQGDSRFIYVLCDDETFYFISRLNNEFESEDTGMFFYTDTTFQLIGDIGGDMGIIPYTLIEDDLIFNSLEWLRR